MNVSEKWIAHFIVNTSTHCSLLNEIYHDILVDEVYHITYKTSE